MSCQKYKVCYFQARGLGELLRLLFAEAGVEYEDVRYSKEQWPEVKTTMMFGQMPVLFVDGEQIAHSRAACRYLAREFGLDGGNSLNAAKVDMWMEIMFEALTKLPFTEQDKEKKAQLMAEAMKEHVIPRIQKFEDSLKGVYLFGDNPTAADVVIYSAVGMLKMFVGDDYLENLPKIKVMMKEFEERPNIAKWIKERPVTDN